MKYFSGHETDYLDYQDLLQILMTCDDANLRAEICQRNPIACELNQFLDKDVEKALASLFY